MYSSVNTLLLSNLVYVLHVNLHSNIVYSGTGFSLVFYLQFSNTYFFSGRSKFVIIRQQFRIQNTTYQNGSIQNYEMPLIHHAILNY